MLHGRVSDVVKIGKTHALSQSHFNHFDALLGGEALEILPTKERVATYFEDRMKEFARVAEMRNLAQAKTLLSSESVVSSVGLDALDGVGGFLGDNVLSMSMKDLLLGTNAIKGIRWRLWDEDDTKTCRGPDFQRKALSRAKIVGKKGCCFKCITKFWKCDGENENLYHYSYDDPTAFENRIALFDAYDVGLCLAFGGLIDRLKALVPEQLMLGY